MLYVYSILDKVSKSWLSVSLFNNDDVAKRAFIDLLNSAGFSPHKGDYAIYCLSSFDSYFDTDFFDHPDFNNPIGHDIIPYLVFDGADLAKEANNE